MMRSSIAREPRTFADCEHCVNEHSDKLKGCILLHRRTILCIVTDEKVGNGNCSNDGTEAPAFVREMKIQRC